MIPDRPLPPGPKREDCACGCGVFSVVRKNGHARGCKCRRCLGGRNRRAGMRKQRAAKKMLGLPDNKFRSVDGNEEMWLGPVRVEVKSGKQVGAVAQFLRAEAQSERSRAVGDVRPFAFVQMPEAWNKEGIVSMRLSAWREHVAPLFEETA